jgi:hypothetical protein
VSSVEAVLEFGEAGELVAASKAIEATGSENHAERLSSVVRCRSLRAFLVGAEAFLLIMDLTAASPSEAAVPLTTAAHRHRPSTRSQ